MGATTPGGKLTFQADPDASRGRCGPLQRGEVDSSDAGERREKTDADGWGNAGSGRGRGSKRAGESPPDPCTLNLLFCIQGKPEI
jgi:hypothetical protein